MKDFLKGICGKLSINLIYTSNKVTVLSNGINNNIPFIRAHKMFAECPEEIAEAVIGYYSNQVRRDERLNLIDKYVKEHFKYLKYKIMTPDMEFQKRMSRNARPSSSNQEQSTSLVEFEITQMSVKDFWGDKTNISQNNGIRLNGAEVLEVDIEVDEFDE